LFIDIVVRELNYKYNLERFLSIHCSRREYSRESTKNSAIYTPRYNVRLLHRNSCGYTTSITKKF